MKDLHPLKRCKWIPSSDVSEIKLRKHADFDNLSELPNILLFAYIDIFIYIIYRSRKNTSNFEYTLAKPLAHCDLKSLWLQEWTARAYSHLTTYSNISIIWADAFMYNRFSIIVMKIWNIVLHSQGLAEQLRFARVCNTILFELKLTFREHRFASVSLVPYRFDVAQPFANIVHFDTSSHCYLLMSLSVAPPIYI